MTTRKSPKSVLLMAYGVGLLVYKEYSSPCSRKRFMLPQLFACLVLREFLKMSYRGLEALLRDCTELRAAIDMVHTPDHATLHRAFVLLMNRHNLDQLLDRTIMLAEYGRLLGNTVAIDSTLMEIRHRSGHYEQRRRHYAKRRKISADTKRSRTAKRVPNLMICVNTRSHLTGPGQAWGLMHRTSCRRWKISWRATPGYATYWQTLDTTPIATTRSPESDGRYNR